MENDELQRRAFWPLKKVNLAIRDWEMIANGDRVAVAVSGGKDSLTLLKLLDVRRSQVSEQYDLLAIHIIGDASGPVLPAHPPLLSWLDAQGYPYAVERLRLPEGEKLPLDCQRCTWNRRRTLFETALRYGCNVIAFGHHADDFAQTTLLNVLYQARAETMAPRGNYFDGALRLVRPLCYLSEKEVRRFARGTHFPTPPPECPRGEYSRRRLIAGLVRQVEPECQNIRMNLLRLGLRVYQTGSSE